MKIKLLFALLFICGTVFSQQNYHESHAKCAHADHKGHIQLEVNEALADYDIKFYYLDIEATTASAALTGFTQVTATAINNMSDFVIELNSGITVDSVQINGITQNFSHSSNLITTSLENPIAANEIFTAKIFYNRPGSLNTDGIYNVYDSYWGKYVTYTLSEPYHAKNWFACKQDLHDKADSLWVFVTVDEDLKAGSNGILTQVTDLGNGKHRYEWKSNYPIVYYLISIAVADYTEYSFYSKPEALNGDSILVQNYLYNDYAYYDEQVQGVDYTDDLLNLFSDKYSIYPFWEEKYGHCYAPLGGAMEHQTMTTTGSSAFYIIAHELGHQWFGDNVTCATWQDIWINEGFASYSEYLAFEYLTDAETAKNHLINARDYAMYYNSGSVYVPFEDLNNEGRIFSWYLTYRKGLCLVHMIRNEFNNDELFFETLSEFQIDFKDSVATGDDFRDYISEKTSIDFTNFFDEWYYGEGFPSYQLNWYQVDQKLKLEISQTTSASVTSLFTNTLEIKVNYSGGDTLIRVKPEQNGAKFEFDFNHEVTSIQIDPDLKVLSKNNTVTNEVGISDNKVQFEIFPNPVKDAITFEASEAIDKLEIYNASGKLIYFNYPKQKLVKIDFSEWKNGIYFVKAYSGAASYSERIIKN